MDYAIRRLRPAHIPAFIDLRRRMFVEVGFEDLNGLDEASEAYFASAVPDGTFVGFLAVTAADEIVGSAGLSRYQMPPKPLQPDGCFGYLSSMYVMPDHRRRGLAGRLTRAVVDCAHELGLTWVMLHASPAGRQIYEAAGFTEFDEMGLHVPTAVAGGDAGS